MQLKTGSRTSRCGYWKYKSNSHAHASDSSLMQTRQTHRKEAAFMRKYHAHRDFPIMQSISHSPIPMQLFASTTPIAGADQYSNGARHPNKSFASYTLEWMYYPWKHLEYGRQKKVYAGSNIPTYYCTLSSESRIGNHTMMIWWWCRVFIASTSYHSGDFLCLRYLCSGKVGCGLN